MKKYIISNPFKHFVMLLLFVLVFVCSCQDCEIEQPSIEHEHADSYLWFTATIIPWFIKQGGFPVIDEMAERVSFFTNTPVKNLTYISAIFLILFTCVFYVLIFFASLILFANVVYTLLFGCFFIINKVCKFVLCMCK